MPEESIIPTPTPTHLRVLVVAPERHALREPLAGGLETVVWNRVRWLRQRGHEVLLCAADGSDFLGHHAALRLPRVRWSSGASDSDTAYPPAHRRAMDAAFAGVRHVVNREHVDVVDNHSLHGTPIRWSDELDVPIVTTLHTPPLTEIVDAARALPATASHQFLSVSGFTARTWSAEGVSSVVVPNGVDTARWALGRGGDTWVWFGRIVPEKAPHLAIRAARRAGARLVLAGRIGDPRYFARQVEPMLGGGIRYAGPLHQDALNRLVGRSAVALATPMWPEPFGLVLAEALTTGTPVAAFDAGGVPEVLDGLPGTAIVPAGDVDALAAEASRLAEGARRPLAREDIRLAAVDRFSLQRRHREIERVLQQTARLHRAGAT